MLCFTRCPKELIDALLESPLAARFAADGVELQPGWAGGRLVFADGATEAAFSDVTNPWHIAVSRTSLSTASYLWGKFRLKGVSFYYCRSVSKTHLQQLLSHMASMRKKMEDGWVLLDKMVVVLVMAVMLRNTLEPIR